MAGKVIPLFNMREFNYSDLGAAKTQETVMSKALDVSGHTEGVIEVRVHSGSIGASGAKVEVILTPVAPCAEDPSQDFVVASGASKVEINSGTAAPILVTAALTAGFGGWLQLSVKGTQATGSPTTMDTVLSAVLVVKE